MRCKRVTRAVVYPTFLVAPAPQPKQNQHFPFFFFFSPSLRPNRRGEGTPTALSPSPAGWEPAQLCWLPTPFPAACTAAPGAPPPPQHPAPGGAGRCHRASTQPGQDADRGGRLRLLRATQPHGERSRRNTDSPRALPTLRRELGPPCVCTEPWKFPENSQREERHHPSVAPSVTFSSPGGHGGSRTAFRGTNWNPSPARCLQTQQEEEEERRKSCPGAAEQAQLHGCHLAGVLSCHAAAVLP